MASARPYNIGEATQVVVFVRLPASELRAQIFVTVSGFLVKR